MRSTILTSCFARLMVMGAICLLIFAQPLMQPLQSAPEKGRTELGPWEPFFEKEVSVMGLPFAQLETVSNVRIRTEDWAWATQTAEKMGFGKNLVIVPEVELLGVQKVSSEAGHSAFTDLIRYRDEWLCVFRESSSHVPGTDGVIRVLSSKDADTWESAAVISEAGIDLRDPKICQMPDGRLMITLGGSLYDGESAPGTKRKLTGGRSRVTFSTNGRTWTVPQPVTKDGDWLWRVTPVGNEAYGMSYTHNAGDQNFKLHLWKTTDGAAFENIGNPDLGRQCRPNETTLRFLPDQTMQALVRNELKGGHTFFGTALPPYKTWNWTDTGEIIQGPNFIHLADGRMIYAGRDFKNGKPNTTVGRLSPEGYATPLLALPSGGDTSYPGLAIAPDGTLVVSYYSSHEGKTAIYLAKLKVN